MSEQVFQTRYETYRTAVESYLETLFAGRPDWRDLYESMRYSLLAGGKRIRPVLTLEFARLAGLAGWKELVHNYSLIHDDLPCMDNDDLRRGKPTNHKVYGETLAVLAGDALQPEAYRLILTAPGLDESRRAACGRILAEVSGADGMVAGQVLDTLHAPKTEVEVTEVHRLKTGAMIAVACRLGVAAAGGSGGLMAAAETYAQELGLAFQIRDDMLDVCGDAAEFGKPIGFQQAISFKIADMATKLRCARFLVYSAAELKEAHAPYGMESAMAKMYASDIALEVTNDALQIHGGAGFMKGMEVERAYRDAKITTIYEGTNEIQRVVNASHILGKAPKSSGGSSSQPKKPAPVTGVRKKVILRDGSPAEQVAALVEHLKKDGHDFTVGIPLDTPISQAERVVSAGKGIGGKKNMKLIEELAKQAGAAIGSSRPVAETLKYVPLNRYVGMSGQKFTGNLYIACGISGAVQHLKGIKDASTIVAINTNAGAPIFKNCDYGIVGDVNEILPLLTAALDTGEKQPAPPMVKMKRPRLPKPEPIGKRYVCGGCGYEYIPELGDPDGDIAPGTLFEKLPEDWVCPECAEPKDQFIEA